MPTDPCATAATMATEWAVRSERNGRIIPRRSQGHAMEWLSTHEAWELVSRVVVVGEWRDEGVSS